MAGDLKNAVAARINDGQAGFLMFFAELLENGRAGGGLIAEDAAAACFFDKADR